VLVHLIGAGVAWLAAWLLLAAVLQWSGSRAPSLSARDGVTALARSLNDIRPAASPERHTWTVTKASTFQRALVIEVNALNPADARSIAERLVNAVGAQYDEVLIYVQSIDLARDPLVRRIGWTVHRGYSASTF
jgi:hypothetical protein